MKKVVMTVMILMISAGGLFPSGSGVAYFQDHPDDRILHNALSRMPLEDKLNGRIGLVLPKGATAEAENIARAVEFKWNSGSHDDALGLIDGLAEYVDVNRVGVDIKWLEPIFTSQPESSAGCYRISNYDSIYVVDYDIDRSTGNMIAVLLRRGDNFYSIWSVHFSGDGGQFWMQTFSHGSPNFIYDVDCAVSGNRGHVAYIDNADVIVYRFRMSDGAQIDFDPGASSVTALSAGTPLAEVDLVSAGSYYLAANSWTNSVYIRESLWGESWLTIPTAIPEAVDRGIDLAVNEVDGGFNGTYKLFLSFMSNPDHIIYVYGFRSDGTGWDMKLGRDVYSLDARFSSIDAYEDNVYLTYEVTVPKNLCVRSHSLDGGSTWGGYYLDDPSHPQRCPGVTAHSGSGLAFAYRIYIANPPYYMVAGRLQWGDYTFFQWNGPIAYMSTPANDVKPAIDALPSGYYGILGVQSSGTAPHLAFFCITESCCVIAGDANGDNTINIGDAVYLINYIFQGGPPPLCVHQGDANCDDGVNVADAVYLITYIFKGGPEPCCP